MRNSIAYRLLLPALAMASACTPGKDAGTGPTPCTAQWQQDVEARLQTGDPEGHGPDTGSQEWRSVVEFKLGIRGDPDIPSRDSDEWCVYIDGKIHGAGS